MSETTEVVELAEDWIFIHLIFSLAREKDTLGHSWHVNLSTIVFFPQVKLYLYNTNSQHKLLHDTSHVE